MQTLRIPVCALADLPHARTAKFAWEAYGHRRTGFVVNWHGRLRAYVNECAHIAISMDFFENDFFDEERCHIVCAMHGALYEPDTGACVSGPPLGAALEPLRAEVEGGEVVVYVEARPPRPA